MNIGGPLLDGNAGEARQFDAMVHSGVESVRGLFDWATAQPYPNWSEVPAAQAAHFADVGGIPTDFAVTDQIVALASARRLTVLPIVLFAPVWDAAPHPTDVSPSPASTAPYAAYLTALVDRYGPHGTFWLTHSPKVPIRMWQVWNEPSIINYWSEQPFAPSYVALLRAAHAAIKRADPGAKVVLAGLPNYSWKDLPSIYAVHRARRYFDVVSIHPYAPRPADVLAVLRRVRRVMDRAGDRRKTIIADEVSWPSSLGKTGHTQGYSIATTEAGQARKLAQLLPMLAAKRRALGLVGVDWYTWSSPEAPGALLFSFSGLTRFLHGRYVAKPALAAFRKVALALEGCRRKGAVATVCRRARRAGQFDT